jgi:hypothetical protein
LIIIRKPSGDFTRDFRNRETEPPGLGSPSR